VTVVALPVGAAKGSTVIARTPLSRTPVRRRSAADAHFMRTRYVVILPSLVLRRPRHGY